MRLLALATLLSASTLWATPTITVDQPLQIGEITNHLEEIATPPEFFDTWDKMEEQAREDAAAQEGSWNDPLDPDDFLDPIPDDFDLPLPIPGPIGGGSQTLVILEQIVNLAERVWKFIADNKPVINVKRSYANALPRGVRSSEELDGFSTLQYRSFRMSAKNGFKQTVYDVTFTLVHRYGGNYNGEGYYLENATVLPHKIEALWGYTVEANVDNVGAVNVGTRDKPVGSLVMEMGFKAGTIIKATEYRAVYEFRGDSNRVTTIANDRGDGQSVPGGPGEDIKHTIVPTSF